MKDLLVNRFAKRLLNRHLRNDEPNVFLFGTPRGGTTWLMELIWSQPGFKACNEPLDLRNPMVRKNLGISTWEELYGLGSHDKLEAYFRAFDEGRLHIVDPLPGRGRYHRFVTKRQVFKIIHGAEDRVDWLARNFQGRPLLLLRHPLAVTVSRQVRPRLATFLRSDYRRHFGSDELHLAEQVVKDGSELEKGVLDWCLQTAVPLRNAKSDWLVVTYEQLVLEPEVVIATMAREFGLPDPRRMMRNVSRASKSSNQSNPEARALMSRNGPEGAPRRLLSRWRKKVSEAEEQAAMEILGAFGLDVYQTGSDLPNRHWLTANRYQGRVLANPPLVPTEF